MIPQPPRTTRRVIFTGAISAVSGCALLALGGCAEGQSDGGHAQPGGSGGDGGRLLSTSKVPVGGGVILVDQQVVVTQPTKGSFRAFSAVCTHMGFTVTSVTGGVIHCDHHGSAFSATTGKVEQGPAATPLQEIAVQVKDGGIYAS